MPSGARPREVPRARSPDRRTASRLPQVAKWRPCRLPHHRDKPVRRRSRWSSPQSSSRCAACCSSGSRATAVASLVRRRAIRPCRSRRSPAGRPARSRCRSLTSARGRSTTAGASSDAAALRRRLACMRGATPHATPGLGLGLDPCRCRSARSAAGDRTERHVRVHERLRVCRMPVAEDMAPFVGNRRTHRGLPPCRIAASRHRIDRRAEHDPTAAASRECPGVIVRTPIADDHVNSTDARPAMRPSTSGRR